MSGRRTKLLQAAAEALEQGEMPLSEHFLCEHEVTAAEAMSLSQQLAIGARVVAYGLDHPQSHEGIAVMTRLVESL
jgi:hypothetical protein